MFLDFFLIIRGKSPSKGRGLLYDKADFAPEFFPENWDVVFDRLGDGCQVDFPIKIITVLKYGKKCFKKNNDGSITEKPRTFYETLSVILFKKRC